MGADMNVFVTGGAGYIGSVCVEELLNAGHEVTVFDSLIEGHPAAVDRRAKLIGALAQRQRRRPSGLSANPCDQAVIHFAAHALVSESMTNPGKYFRNNVASGLEPAGRSRCDRNQEVCLQLLHAQPTELRSGMPMTEDLPQRPINPYGESKLMFERILQWSWEIHGLAFVAFRYFNAAGASEKFGEHHRVETHLIPNVLKVPLGQAPHCEVYGADYPTPDGTCIRDYIHVIDLAQAHILALQPGKRGFYNLGNGSGYSVREVIRACEQCRDAPSRRWNVEQRAGDPPRLVAAAEKAVRNSAGNPACQR